MVNRSLPFRTLAVFVAGAGLTMAWWLRSSNGLRTGQWHGKTNQALPIDFVVARTDDGLVIDNWMLRLDLVCEQTGRLVHGAVFSTVPVPIQDGQFALQIANLNLWHRLNGKFARRDEVEGEAGSVWPALTGTGLEELGTEKCTAADLRWRARPDEDETAATVKDLDFEIHVERDNLGRVKIFKYR